MRKRLTNLCLAISLVGLPAAFAAGCDKEISSTSKKSVDKDGTVKSEETRVTKAPDGSITKEETSKKIEPPKKP